MTSVIDLSKYKQIIDTIKNSNNDINNDNNIISKEIFKKEGIYNNQTYQLIKYNKKYLNSKNYNFLGKARSIICKNNKIIA